MKWDIDKAITKFESHLAEPGTTITRILMDVVQMKSLGIKPTAEDTVRGSGRVWSFAVGLMGRPKLFFHGYTIREAVLRATKAIKVISPAILAEHGLYRPAPKRRKRLDKPKKRVTHE